MQTSRMLVAALSATLAGGVWASQGRITSTEFNPAISLILDSRLSNLDLEENTLPGFQPGGETEPPSEGFSIGESELNISANIDDLFYGKFTGALEEEDDEIVTEIEEAYFETLGLGYGLTLRGGRFFSDFGYHNNIHTHAFDFVDAPLVYQGVFGTNLIDDGAQIRWVKPLPFYWESAVEFNTGEEFPGGDNDSGSEGIVFWSRVGGDIGTSSSYRAGVSFFSSEFDEREAGEEEDETSVLEDGEVEVFGVDLVYKWAPDGNPAERNLKVVFEYLLRDENGLAKFGDAEAEFDGQQDGLYLIALYQFRPRWKVGFRFDQVSADNDLTNFDSTGDIDFATFEADSGFGDLGADPQQFSASLEYNHSEFSRIRLQYSHFDNDIEEDDRLFLQYTFSLGAHGAHRF